jgi:hypothetical protein
MAAWSIVTEAFRGLPQSFRINSGEHWVTTTYFHIPYYSLFTRRCIAGFAHNIVDHTINKWHTTVSHLNTRHFVLSLKLWWRTESGKRFVWTPPGKIHNITFSGRRLRCNCVVFFITFLTRFVCCFLIYTCLDSPLPSRWKQYMPSKRSELLNYMA